MNGRLTSIITVLVLISSQYVDSYPTYAADFPCQDTWWEDVSGTEMPENAVVAWYKDLYLVGQVYVGRVLLSGQLAVGKVVQSVGLIYAGDNGKEVSKNKFQVLVSKTPLEWVLHTSGDIPNGAIRGGWSGYNDYYVCRVEYKSDVKIVGKLNRVQNSCYYVADKKEYSSTYYEVLRRKSLTCV